jgi:hypothetical protein
MFVEAYVGAMPFDDTGIWIETEMKNFVCKERGNCCLNLNGVSMLGQILNERCDRFLDIIFTPQRVKNPCDIFGKVGFACSYLRPKKWVCDIWVFKKNTRYQ